MNRCFGIIPAAGHSRRMGTNKLLLPWRDSTIIQEVLQAWCKSRVDRVVVVLRKGDFETREIVRDFDVDVVLPKRDPDDMKQSVQYAIRHIQGTYRPTNEDNWLLAPADLPTLQTATINQLADEVASLPLRIIVPYQGGQRGHPVVFPFSKADEVFRLTEEQGVNALLEQNEFARLELTDIHFDDVDTPSDYQRMSELDSAQRPDSDMS